MFMNRALSIQVVKKNRSENDANQSATPLSMDPEQISKIALEHAQQAAVIVAALYTGKVFLTTVSEIALITARAKIR